MLPYTPLHYLLFQQSEIRNPKSEILVMTSGNLSEEPIAYTNDDARAAAGQSCRRLPHARPGYSRALR